MNSLVKGHVSETQYFYLKDLTDEFRKLVKDRSVADGLLMAQLLHTTGILAVNELDEPMLVGDISKVLNRLVDPGENYLHNSGLRTKNLCADDNKCDRNAHAHIQSFAFGSSSISLLIQKDWPPQGSIFPLYLSNSYTNNCLDNRVHLNAGRNV